MQFFLTDQQTNCSLSSIYQDVPLYNMDQFTELAPPAAVVDDEHQLMLNRLSFELAERQRYVFYYLYRFVL